MSMIDWDELILNLPQVHFLQTAEWAEVKKEVGWRARQLVWRNAEGQLIGAANLLIRSIRPLGYGPKISIGYIPRGPMLDWSDADLRQKVLKEIQEIARSENLIFLKIDPEIELGRGIPGEAGASVNPVGEDCSRELAGLGWRESLEQVQFKNTAVLDLSGSEEEWLKCMKQKARYNLRLSQRSGVEIRVANDQDLSVLYQMYAQTAARDGFIIREAEYYFTVWRRFIQAGMAEPLIAEVDGQPIAGLILFHVGKRAWYFYGMSTSLHREKMPNYLLQWEAMCKAKAAGCEYYDLWGAPDVFNPDDRMYGVFRFKEGLGAEVVRTSGAWDYPVKPFFYYLYHRVLPGILGFTRRLRRQKLQQEVS
jgi:peptidoglycan pentaglycine glycine transferase (the first glycine)